VTFDLERFLTAQSEVYPDVVDELRRGRKTSHWIWFIFPQLAGLGWSANVPPVRDLVARGGARLSRIAGTSTGWGGLGGALAAGAAALVGADASRNLRRLSRRPTSDGIPVSSKGRASPGSAASQHQFARSGLADLDTVA